MVAYWSKTGDLVIMVASPVRQRGWVVARLFLIG